MNPEFQRYLWTEFSPQRLVVMPVVLAAVFAIAALDRQGRIIDVTNAAVMLYAALAFFWGTRRAAESVISELRNGTWDLQRMSAQGAFGMTWAKLFGATSYAWYGSLICIGVIGFVAYSPMTAEQIRWQIRIDPGARFIGIDAVLLIVVAITGHAIALASALALMRKRRGDRNTSVTFSHLVGFLVCAGLYWNLFKHWLGHETIDWFGMAMPPNAFVLASAAGFMFWAVLAVQRLMRAELLYRVQPWAWVAFALYLGLWLSGFLSDPRIAYVVGLPKPIVVLMVTSSFVYLAFLFEEKNQVTLRAWFRDIAAFRLGRAVVDAPAWAQLLALSLVLAAVVLALPDDRRDLIESFRVPRPHILVLAGVAYMLRDLALLLFLNLGRNQRRADTSGAVYLIVLYLPAPLLANLLDAREGAAALVPIYPDLALITIISPAVQAAFMVALLCWRLSRRPQPAAVGTRR